MFKYYIESFSKPDKKPLLIRFSEVTLTERYDYKLQKWVEDINMDAMFFGEILVDSIPEEKAKEIIRINA